MRSTSLRQSCWRLCCGVLFLFFLTVAAGAADEKPGKPAAKDKCPVCGMFVYKYPDWVAQALFRDGARLYFDGAKDFFKFYFNPSKYLPGKVRKDMVAVWVTDYYSLEGSDGFRAYYVIGSDVLGPMGRELIPLAREAEAREFLKDHKGKKILRFQEVTPEILNTLD
jgi:copper chaperone NosL